MRQTKLDDFIELEEQNKKLEKKVQDEVNKNRQKDKVLFQQAKFASMGEMLVNISHQWRQPLMELSSLFLPIEAKLKMNQDIEKDELREFIEKQYSIIKYMSSTIDDFKNFFAKDKQKVEFEVFEQVKSTINIISGSLKSYDIKLNIVIKKNPTLCGYKNEFSQVLINIINNARDILIQRKIKNPQIDILIQEEKEFLVTTINDNAGGVKVKPLSKVFDPFFTFDKKDGTGIGLFISKLIIENNMKGQLDVVNLKQGASFKIYLPKQ
ncbi:MAG: sensor histidine kinase [Campylobacterota bacterium]